MYAYVYSEGGIALIYMDHAATTPVKDEVLASMLPYFTVQFANASSGYAQAREGRAAIDRARGAIAGAIGAKKTEIIFTSGGSESDNWAIFGVALANPHKKHIITTRIEHHAVLHTCQALEKRGYEVTYLDVDSLGRVSQEGLERAIRPDTLMASVMLANNEVGTIEPISCLAEIAHRHGVLMHTDAVQAVGHIPVNVETLGVDLLSMSAHKFGGPKGVGALYIRSGTRIDNLIFGGAQEKGMRAGTENVPGIVGMGKALSLANQDMLRSQEFVSCLRDTLEQGLMALGGIRVNGDRCNRLPGHLHVTIDGVNTPLMLMQLDMAGIAVSAGSACTSGATERSHVIEAMGLAGEKQADIRFSLGTDNNPEEIGTVIESMRRILKR